MINPKVLSNARQHLLEPTDHFPGFDRHPYRDTVKDRIHIKGTKLVVDPVDDGSYYLTINPFFKCYDLAKVIQVTLDEVLLLKGVFELDASRFIQAAKITDLSTGKKYSINNPHQGVEIELPFESEEEIRNHLKRHVIRRIVL